MNSLTWQFRLSFPRFRTNISIDLLHPQPEQETKSADSLLKNFRRLILPILQTVSEDSAVKDVKRVFEEIKREKRLPFVPNFFKTLANAPKSLEATWIAYREISTRGSLPEALKEMIFVAISVARSCKYCEAAHLAFCSLLGVELKTLKILTEQLEQLRPERTKDIVQFSVKCALEPRNVGPSDFVLLRKHGMTDGEIVETISMCGFAMYATTVADVLKLDIDREVSSVLAPLAAGTS